MRRFFILLVLSALSLPMGMSVVGCHKGIGITYCNGGDSGLEVGQASDIKLNPQITGISLNFGQTQQLNAPSTTDCHGNTVAESSYSYGSSNPNIIDVSPVGQLCAGTWNRNSPAGIGNYTYCTPSNVSGVSYLTASAGGASSNTVAVYSHPTITSIVLGPNIASNGEPTAGCISQGNAVTLSSLTYNGTTPMAGVVSNITSYSISSNVATFYTPGGSNLSVGQLVVLNGFDNALTLSSAANANAGSTVYTGYIVGGAANALVGEQVTIAGFDHAANNGTFTITASTVTTITLNNPSGVADTYAATATPTAAATFLNGLVETVSSVSGASFTVNLTNGSTPMTLNNAPATFVYGTATTTVGNVVYAATNGNIVSIEDTTQGLATAQQPGATLITAQLSDASSSAGYFYTCPPAQITITPGYGTGNSVVVDPEYTDPLTAVVTDTNGVTITGLNLTYYTSSPAINSVNSSGLITASYPGAGSVTAECLPENCNPAPLTQTGVYGTGTPVTSNTLHLTTPGTTASILYMASTQSNYYASLDFTTQTVAPPVHLPYTPNSLIMDPAGGYLYFGASQELMIVNAAAGTLTHEDPTVPGNVIGISPNGATLVISDPVHDLLYFYSTSTYGYTTYGGTGTKAVFTPDSQTAYISGGSQQYVYSVSFGWNTYTSSSANVNDVAVVSPAVGAFFSGTQTTALSYCPNTNVNPTNFFPQTSDSQPATLKVTATNDGNHILGANLVGTTPTILDIGIVPPVQACPSGGVTPTFQSSLRSATAPNPTVTESGVTAASVTGIDVASNSTLAFLTYTAPSGAATTGTILPGYAPVVSGIGTVENVTLASGATAPVTGIFSQDNLNFYAGTSGDNQVHVISTGYAQISGWTISGDVVIFKASNTFSAGQQVTLSGFATSTFFNGQTVTVLSTGLSTTQFEASFTHADGSALEYGVGSTGTPLDVQQINPQLPNINSPGVTAPPNLLAVKPRNIS